MNNGPTQEETSAVVDRILEAVNGEDISVGISALLTAVVVVLTDFATSRAEVVGAVNQIRDLVTPMAVVRTWEEKHNIVNH